MNYYSEPLFTSIIRYQPLLTTWQVYLSQIWLYPRSETPCGAEFCAELIQDRHLDFSRDSAPVGRCESELQGSVEDNMGITCITDRQIYRNIWGLQELHIKIVRLLGVYNRDYLGTIQGLCKNFLGNKGKQKRNDRDYLGTLSGFWELYMGLNRDQIGIEKNVAILSIQRYPIWIDTTWRVHRDCIWNAKISTKTEV